MSGFKFCRICLYFDGSLSSLLDGNGEYAEHLLLLTGVDVTKNFQNNKNYQALICSKCLETLKGAAQMRKQAVNANQEYFEPISKVALLRGKIEESLEELTTDAVVVNLKEVSGFKKKACSICGKVMLRSSLRRHVREIHEARMKKSFGDKEKFFYDSLQLQPKPLVQKSTEALKKFECFLCKQELSTKKRLEDHIRNIHEERRRFFCDFCNSCYWKRDSIYRHMKTHLETNKKDRGNATLPQQFFECWVPKCHQKFMNKRQLSLHCSKHHNKAGSSFACDCSAVFKKLSYLRRHIQRVHLKIKSKVTSI